MLSTTARTGRRIFFEGDSLSFLGTGNVQGVYEMPIAAYNGLTKPYNIGGFFLAVGGSTLDPDDSNCLPERIGTILSAGYAGDIVVVFAGTNDLSDGPPALGHTAQETYDDLCAYSVQLRNAGLRVVAVTMLAKNRASDPDPAATEVKRLAYNALIRGGSQFAFDAVCDAGALPQFDSVADASNTTYYNADGVHLTSAGYAAVATALTATLQTLI